MTDNPCPRRWQVEAARDGRLTGSDLANALRHRAECGDCKHANRLLHELGRTLKALPVQPTDQLVQRRTRQALLSAWNEHVLEEPRPRFRLRAALIVASCAIAGVAFAVGYPLVHRTSPRATPSVVLRSTQPNLEPATQDVAQSAPRSTPTTLPKASAREPTSAKPRPSSVPAKLGIAQPERNRAALPSSPEDDTYLQIVELLRKGHEPEARAKAVQYLVQFPHGFRRLEVEQIAKR